MWEIKSKNNVVKAIPSTKPEYNGEWMGECYVSVTIESPTPVDFEIGDYLMYRGERFEINYNPGKIKCAEPYVKGDAFKYENVKFNSLADELTRCDFLDVVLNDNQLHFTGLPKFSFYGNVQDLANRMQANLDRTYGKNTWNVVVSPEYTDRTEINVSVDNIKVQGALSILVNNYKTYYTISGRTLTIGAAGIPAGHLFKYGKGNGLYEIEQNAEADQAIVTRLRAYGSTRNLPHRYYNSLTGADGQKLIPDNMAVQNLMLPSFPYPTQDPYITSPNFAKLGIREGTIFFDGSQEGLEEIYPSIEGMTAEQLKAAGVPCNSTGALDVLVSAEQMTDDGVGKINEGETETTATPPTFKVTLKDLGFDINDHLTTETATLSFKTGMLGGRDFEIVDCKKDGDNYELELNRVYDDGIKLWFPYKDYNAAAGDKFVLLHIEMPEVYIKAASQRLLTAATEWLQKNDYSRSIYSPKIDEIFMARQHDAAMASGGTIKSLHDTIKEGMLLLFEDEDLNINASIFIDRLTIKEEGKIPTYEVVLKEEKTVGRLDKMQNQIDSLASGKGQGAGYTAAQIRSFIDAYGGPRFLSKIKDDRTPYKISSDKAFEIGEYIAGASGGIFGKDADGDTFIEIARLYVRVRAFFEQLTIIEANTLAGKQYTTPGGSIKCTKVEESTSANAGKTYRCYFLSEQDGEKTESKMVVGDQAVSQMFNAKSGTSNKIGNHRYWRLVTGVNNDAYADSNGNHYGYIELSATDCESGSDIPKAGDIIAQLGNRTDRTRQTAIIISTVDADSPSMKFFSGINSFSLADKTAISFGSDPTTGQIFFRLGASGSKQYLEYTQSGGLKVAGSISTLSTIGGKPVGDYVSDAAKAEADKAKAELEASIKALQEQVDGVIESFSGFGAPSLTNFPAVEWTTDAERKAHDRDIYTDRTPYVDDATTPTSGHSWKWYYNTPTDYGWTKIADSDAVKALQMAQMSVRDSDVYFISHTSATSAPPLPVIGINGEITDAKGWSTSAPAWQQDKYIWQTTYTVKGDGSVSFTDPTCISGRNGKGIASITEQYYLSTSRDNPVGSSVGWTDRDHREQWTVGKYWWTRSKITYTDGTSEYIGEVCVTGADGVDGTSVLARYSSDLANWHPTMLATDIYMQTSSDGGKTWSPAVRMTGSDYTENLMLKTEERIELTYSTDGDHYFELPDRTIHMEQGQTYTISGRTNAEAFTNVHTASIGLSRCALWICSNPQSPQGEVNQVVSGTDMATDGSKGHTFTWDFPTGEYYLRTNFYSAGTWWVEKVKVEKGRNPSPVWTPNSSEMVGVDGRWQKMQWAKNNSETAAPTSGWQDTPLSALPGEYIWTRSGWVIPPATEPSSYGDAVRITGDAGSNGSDAYRLDLDNEMAAVAANANGQLVDNSKLPTANARVYKGTQLVTSGVTFSVPQYEGVSAATISSEGKVQLGGAIQQDVARITVQAVVDGLTLTTIMTVYKVKPGHDGASAKVVVVNADSQVFSYADDFSGSPSPSAIRITASVQGIASPAYSWSYKFPGDADFTAYGAETGAVLTLPPTWQQWGNRRSVTWRCTVDGVHDEVTVAKVSSGKNGTDGVPGAPGKDGQTTYTWIRYADDAQGGGISNDPTGKEYIGFAYNKTTSSESNDPSDYTWSLIKGTDGQPGAPGKDGKTTYTWIKYSDNADGTGMYDIPKSTTKYIGIAVNKTTQTESSNKTDYTWSLFKGSDGTSVTITSQSVTYQVSSSGTSTPTGTWQSSVPTVPAGQYLWTRTTVSYSDGASTTSYSVSRQGENGINGANGRGVLSTAVEYQIGTSGTTAPTGAWSTSVPAAQKGKYLWTRTTVTYTSGNPSVLYSVAYYATDGANGKDGIAGKDGVGISSTVIKYAKSTNSVTAPASGWQDTIPTVPAGQYLWTWTRWTYTDNTTEDGYSVARQGVNGTDGTNGINGDSYTNNILRNTDFREGGRHWWFLRNGVTAVDTSRVFQGRYSVKSTRSGASSTKPCGWIAGNYNEFIPAKKGDVITLSCWVCCDNPSAIDGDVVAEIYWRDAAKQRIATSVYNHASFMPSGPGTWTLRSLTSDVAPEGTAYAELRCQLMQNGTVWFNGIKAEYGSNDNPVWTPFAEGTSLTSESVRYAKTSAASQPSDSAFTATSIGQLGLAPGEYMWSKTEVRYSDGTVTKSYTVARVGTDGTDGLPGAPGKDGKTTYVHFAYANSADGVKDFSTTPFAGAKYLGTCTDFNQPDPTAPSSYQWSEVKGADGKDAYTVLLTNESHTFAGDDSAALASSAECSVIAYKGAAQTAVTIGTVTGAPQGMSVQTANNGTTSAKITVSVTPSLKQRQGVLKIPVSVDGKSFTKDFSWSLALKGEAVTVDKGKSSVTYQASANYTTPPTGQWLTAVPSVPNGHYLWTRTIVTYTDGTSTTAYSVARQGVNGTDGTNGTNGDSYTNNILRNTDFREGGRHWWFLRNGVTAVDTSRVFQGRYSVKSTRSGASSTKPCGWIAGNYNEFIPAKKGDVITLSCWVCCDNPSAIDGDVVAEIYWRDAAKQRIATSVYNHASFMPSGPGTWTLRSLTSDVAPEGTAYAELRCQLMQNGTVWFNGIKAEYGSNDNPVWTPFAEGTSLTSESVRYAKTSAASQPSDSAFTATSIGQLGLAPGEYMWSKTEVRYSDGTATKSYAVSRIGSDGTNGTPGAPGKDGKTTYVHLAYASGITGSLPHPTAVHGFKTTAFEGAKYLGVCTDYNEADPTANVETAYEWSDYKGEAAAVYEIIPSVDVIKRSMTGELSDSSVSCSVYKVTGDTERVLTADKTLKYTRLPDGATGTLTHDGGNSAAIAVLANTEAVVFELYDGSVLLDRERVVVLSDASDIEIGGTNLLRNSAATIERTYTDYGDHNFPLPDCTIHMEQGKVYTISAQTNAEFIDPSKHSNVNGGVLGDWVSLWIVSPSPQPTDGSAVNILVTGTDMASDGSKGHTFKWENPTGDYVLRVNFYAPGTWWVKKIMIERGNVASAWSPSPEDMDYLTRALRESITMDGGLLLATLIKLGYTDPGGLYKVMAGVNGSYTSPSDIAFWSGGEMVDKLPPQSVASVQAASELAAQAEGATYVMRMDGTGYMADGVLRFEKNHIGVGDSVILDNSGLHLMDGDSERLRIANTPIDEKFLNAQLGKTEISAGPFSGRLAFVRRYSHDDGTFYPRSRMTVELWSGTLTKDSFVSLSVSYFDNLVRVGSDVVNPPSWSARPYINVTRGNKYTHFKSGSSTAVSFTVPEDDTYYIFLRIDHDTYTGGPPLDKNSIDVEYSSIKLAGYSSPPTSVGLTLGNNGFAGIFDKIALIANPDGITMMAGNYGLRLAPARGIQYNTTGLDTGWKNLV